MSEFAKKARLSVAHRETYDAGMSHLDHIEEVIASSERLLTMSEGPGIVDMEAMQFQSRAQVLLLGALLREIAALRADLADHDLA